MLRDRFIIFSAVGLAMATAMMVVMGRDDIFEKPIYVVKWIGLAVFSGLASAVVADWLMRAKETALVAAVDRLTSGAQGDLSAAVPETVVQQLPQLGSAMSQLFRHYESAMDKVQTLALYDPVTGLANRTHFYRQVEKMIEQGSKRGVGTMFFIDLDGFKAINDLFGHAVGDQLLQRVATRLKGLVLASEGFPSDETVIARLAGDEFAVYCQNAISIELAHKTARFFVENLGLPYEIDGQLLEVGASLGVSHYPKDGETLAALLRTADVAMYHAKSNGRGRVEVYSATLADQLHNRATLEQDLRIALDARRLHILYQPQYDIQSGAVAGLEALVRWQHPVKGLLTPAEFVPLAEDTGLIVKMGQIILEEVCSVISGWRAQGIACRVAVNISSREIAQPEFFKRLTELMDLHDVPGQALELEMTETLAMELPRELLDELQLLRRRGMSIAIDDFGTGYSNLSRLKELPIDRVKLHQSLTSDLLHSENARTVCNAVVSLAHGLGFTVIAEGVETSEQLELLKILGCDNAQGYVLASPMSEEAARQLLVTFGGGQEPAGESAAIAILR